MLLHPRAALAPRAPDLGEALESEPMRALRAAIRAAERPECERCVCSMWRDPAALARETFSTGSRPMLDASFPSLLAEDRPGTLGTLAGRALLGPYQLLGKHRYDDFQARARARSAILVMPGVANPKLLRTGAFFAAQIDARRSRPAPRCSTWARARASARSPRRAARTASWPWT